tara:strand:- start:2257 stop:2412 length:156 start_codon:yes stop_codon:yes gene_type:complete
MLNPEDQNKESYTQLDATDLKTNFNKKIDDTLSIKIKNLLKDLQANLDKKL